MIPKRLELQNFLSYEGPVSLDFTTFDVACLTGENGAGKSALLDAITWAVWARARGCEGGVNQDRLIRDGTDEMYVDLTFDLQGVTYRIIRSRGSKGNEVRFLVADGDGWLNRAADTASETDQRIVDTLRMDYRTFTASAFFVQGRSDDFLKMTPQHRREVFSQLLDLETYERLAEAAKDRTRHAEAERALHASQMERLADAPQREKDANRLCDELGAKRSSLEKDSHRAKEDLDRANADLVKLEGAAGRLEAEERALAEAGGRLRDEKARLEAKRQALSKLEAIIARRYEAEAAKAEAASLTSRIEQAEKDKDAAAELSITRAELVQQVEGERTRLEQKLADLTDERAKLESELESVSDSASRLAEIGSAIEEAGDLEGASAALTAEIGANTEEKATLAEQIRTADSKTSELQGKLEILMSGGGKGGGECPVCGTALDPAHRERVEGSIKAELSELVTIKKQAMAALRTCEKESARLNEEMKRLAKATKEREVLVATAERLKAEAGRADAISAELTACAAATTEVEASLAGSAFAEKDLVRIRKIEDEIKNTYNPKAHDELKSKLRELQPLIVLASEIENACGQRDGVAEEIADLEKSVDAVERSAHARLQTVEELKTRVASLEPVRVAAEQARTRSDEAVKELSHVTAELAAATERAAAASTDVEALGVATEAEKTSATTKRRYERLREAFSRTGIPQRIIENERPFLEDETNRILGRLCDEPLAVHFQFQKQTKSGTERETLDILVRPHEGNPRDFAMFSGGEAFRVAFAIRLAMSKLLVRRAGARLETLVIDEGFGTQDPAGRERLVEAITLAREEFAKVLVITHLEDLKDRFGVQISVTKGREGSQVALSSA